LVYNVVQEIKLKNGRLILIWLRRLISIHTTAAFTEPAY